MSGRKDRQANELRRRTSDAEATGTREMHYRHARRRHVASRAEERAATSACRWPQRIGRERPRTSARDHRPKRSERRHANAIDPAFQDARRERYPRPTRTGAVVPFDAGGPWADTRSFWVANSQPAMNHTVGGSASCRRSSAPSPTRGPRTRRSGTRRRSPAIRRPARRTSGRRTLRPPQPLQVAQAVGVRREPRIALAGGTRVVRAGDRVARHAAEGTLLRPVDTAPRDVRTPARVRFLRWRPGTTLHGKDDEVAGDQR